MNCSAKTYRCPRCGYILHTGPYDWMLELEESGELICPRCRRAAMEPSNY